MMALHGNPYACYCQVRHHHAALQDGQDVAVKVFKGEASPDGRAADEVAVTCHVDHPNLTRSSSSTRCHWELPIHVV